MLYIGNRAWRANSVVAIDQISQINLRLNGDELNVESEVVATINTNRWYEYEGYYIDLDPEKDTMYIKFYQSFDLFNKSTEKKIVVPVSAPHYSNVTSIEIAEYNNNKTKSVYNDK